MSTKKFTNYINMSGVVWLPQTQVNRSSLSSGLPNDVPGRSQEAASSGWAAGRQTCGPPSRAAWAWIGRGSSCGDPGVEAAATDEKFRDGRIRGEVPRREVKCGTGLKCLDAVPRMCWICVTCSNSYGPMTSPYCAG